MKFLFDHDVPDEVGQVLRHIGHEVRLVREVLAPASEDTEVFGFAQSHGLIIVTCNRDHFVELARKACEAHRRNRSTGSSYWFAAVLARPNVPICSSCCVAPVRAAC